MIANIFQLESTVTDLEGLLLARTQSVETQRSVLETLDSDLARDRAEAIDEPTPARVARTLELEGRRASLVASLSLLREARGAAEEKLRSAKQALESARSRLTKTAADDARRAAQEAARTRIRNGVREIFEGARDARAAGGVSELFVVDVFARALGDCFQHPDVVWLGERLGRAIYQAAGAKR